MQISAPLKKRKSKWNRTDECSFCYQHRCDVPIPAVVPAEHHAAYPASAFFSFVARLKKSSQTNTQRRLSMSQLFTAVPTTTTPSSPSEAFFATQNPMYLNNVAAFSAQYPQYFPTRFAQKVIGVGYQPGMAQKLYSHSRLV